MTWIVSVKGNDGEWHEVGTADSPPVVLRKGEMAVRAEEAETGDVIVIGTAQTTHRLTLKELEASVRWDVKKMSRGEKHWLKRQRGW